ncbi:hypothetical protein J2Y48_003135 [Mycoplana sp. BE70]|uniref:hypothetical protein n=1 Tax=Mycoplana sp. BE70 TaxID=2817775 RepID=UPI002855AA93|nr:hypothetical protein [Mycoplana sp. BE70]MDR6757838.1 hypothetical protein [Mycoplana sp. BE70]
MAWMIVHAEGNFRRPRSIYSFNFKPSPEPQERPRDVVDYAVAKGLATEVPSPTREQAKAIRQRRNRAK